MKRHLFAITVCLLTLLLALAIVGDFVPWLRGPVPESSIWYWPYLLRPLSRLAFPLLAMTFLGAGLWVWLNVPRLPTSLGLLGLMIGIIGWQCSLVYLDHGNLSAELVDRTLADNTTGYFRISADTTDWQQLLRRFPQEMDNFASEHARTHPPGLLLTYRMVLSVTQRLPDSWVQQLASSTFRARCTDLWIHAQRPITVAALWVSSWLPMMAAALTLLPTYLWAKRLANPFAGRIAVSGVAVLPALALFAPLPDQLYLPIMVSCGWLFTIGLQTGGAKRIIASLGAGVLLSFATFLSIGNGAFGLFLLIYGFVLTRNWRSCFVVLSLLGVGCLVVWGINWGWTAVPPWAIIQTALGQHYQLVTHKRSHLLWSLFNLVDLVIFAGVPLWLLFGAMLKTRPNRLAISFLIFLLILDFSGTARGEVGRLWLFLMPIIPLALATDQSGVVTPRRMQLICVAQLLVTLALGWAWQPVEAVIMRPTRPMLISDAPTHSVTERFGADIELIGYDLSRQTPSQLSLKLFWRADRPTFYPYTVFRHLVSADGTLISQKDSWAIDGQWPTSCWDAGDVIIDEAMIQGDTTNGDEIKIGLYDPRDNSRLPLPDGSTSYTIPLSND